MDFLLQIFDRKPSFSKTARSRVGSLDNAKHKPGGGDVKVAILVSLANNSFIYPSL